MLDDDVFKTALIGLFTEAENNPMTKEDYAEKLAIIIDTQIKTGKVKPGISVSTKGSAAAQTGETTSEGEIE